MNKESQAIINIVKQNSSLKADDLTFFINNYNAVHNKVSIYDFIDAFKESEQWSFFILLYKQHISKLDLVNSSKGWSQSFLSLLFTNQNFNIFSEWLNDEKTCYSLFNEILQQYKDYPVLLDQKFIISKFFLNQIFNVSLNINLSNNNLFLLKKIIIHHNISLNELPLNFDKILLDQTHLIPKDFKITNLNLMIHNSTDVLGNSNHSDRYYQLHQAMPRLSDTTIHFLKENCETLVQSIPIKTGFPFISINDSLGIKNKLLKKELNNILATNQEYAEHLFNVIKIITQNFTEIDEQVLLKDIQSKSDQTAKYWHWSIEEFAILNSICHFLKKEYDQSRIFKLISNITVKESFEVHLDLLNQLKNDVPEAFELIPDLKPFPDKPKTLTEIHNKLNYLPKNLKNNRIIPPNIFQEWEGTSISGYTVYLPKTEADLIRTGNILSFCVGQKNYRDNAVSGDSIFLLLMDSSNEPKYCIELSKKKHSLDTVRNEFLFLNEILHRDDFGYRNRPLNNRFNDGINHLLINRHITISDDKWRIIQSKGFQNVNMPDSLVKIIQNKLNIINQNQGESSKRTSLVKNSIFSDPEFYLLLFSVCSLSAKILLPAIAIVLGLYFLF